MEQLPLIDREQELKTAVKVFRAINHPLRKNMLKLLAERQEATVTEIYVALRIEQSVASQHLKILREVKAVETTRMGKEIHYKPNYLKLTRLERIVFEIVSEIISD